MKYKPKITFAQKEILLKFMEEHADFARGNLLGPEGRKLKEKMWKVLTRRLNECDSPTKTTAKWQRVWVDLKNKIKKKTEIIRRHQGGGSGLPQRLNVFEERFLALRLERSYTAYRTPWNCPWTMQDILLHLKSLMLR